MHFELTHPEACGWLEPVAIFLGNMFNLKAPSPTF